MPSMNRRTVLRAGLVIGGAQLAGLSGGEAVAAAARGSGASDAPVVESRVKQILKSVDSSSGISTTTASLIGLMHITSERRGASSPTPDTATVGYVVNR